MHLSIRTRDAANDDALTRFLRGLTRSERRVDDYIVPARKASRQFPGDNSNGPSLDSRGKDEISGLTDNSNSHLAPPEARECRDIRKPA
jgi:hypothetical protein